MAQSTAWHCNFLAPKLREIAGPAQRPLSLPPLVAKDLHRVFGVVFCVFATPVQWGTAGLLSHCSRHLPGQRWPEMKILASRACDENTKPSLPPVSYRSVTGKDKDIWRRKGKALSVRAVPIFFSLDIQLHTVMYLQFSGSGQHCWQLSAHPSNARTPQSQLSLAAPTGSAPGLNVVRLQLETPRCVPATARSLAPPDWCLTAGIVFLSSTYS